MQHFFQFILQLYEVQRCNQALLGFIQTVPCQLHQLVLDESQYSVSQRQGAVWRKVPDDVQQTLLHLSGGLHSRNNIQHLRYVEYVPTNNIGLVLHTFGKRSLYTWFIIIISLSNEPPVRPGLKQGEELMKNHQLKV